MGSSNASGRSDGGLEQRFHRMPARTQRSDSNLSLAMSSNTTTSSFGGVVGGFGGGGRSSRGSYDHHGPLFLATESELGGPDSFYSADFPMAETGGMQHLHLDDHPPPSSSSTFSSPRLRTSTSQQGMSAQTARKRKASSPPADQPPPTQQQQQGGVVGERRTSGQQLQQPPTANRSSPVHHQPHLTQASYSSASSAGLPNGSYASSGAYSLGASSITTVSSQDRLSPGAIVNPELHDPNRASFMNSLSLEPSLRGTEAPSSHVLAAADAQSTAAAAQKMSAENANRLKQASAPKLQANVHICDCCPKKPKKFETEEELR